MSTSKKNQTSALREALAPFFFEVVIFFFEASVFFLSFFVLFSSSHRWQTRGRDLLAKAATTLHFLHKKYWL